MPGWRAALESARDHSGRSNVSCRRPSFGVAFLATALVAYGFASPLSAQGPALRFGDKVPTEVEVIYQRGLEYLARSQTDYGSWGSSGGRGSGEHGISGIGRI